MSWYLGVLGLIGAGPVCVAGLSRLRSWKLLGVFGAVVSPVSVSCAALGTAVASGLRGCFTLVPGLRMAVLLCLRAERVAAVSRPCVALLAFLGVLGSRAMGLRA